MEKKEFKKWIILILVGVLSYWMVNNLGVVGGVIAKIINVLSPFIIGGILAFILNIPMVKIEKLLSKNKNLKDSKVLVRVLSIFLSLLLLVLILGFVAFLLIPELVQNIELLIENIPGLIEKLETFVLNLLDKYPDIQTQIAGIFNENANTSTIIANILNYIVNGAINFVSGLASGIIALFTAVIFAVYMLSQKEYLITSSKKLSYAYLKKKTADKLMEIATLSNNIFSKFISGQCVEAIILGSIFFVVLAIFRFPYALLISVLTAVTALIPIFGAMIAMVIGAILIAITNPIQAIIFVLVFQVIQQIEGNFIYPKVVGKSVGLSPMWALASISIWGSLFGIIGMLFALPLASIIYALIKKDTNERLERNKTQKI